MSSSPTCPATTEDSNYYCHHCNQFITRLFAGTKCWVCKTDFIEEVDHNDTEFMQSLLSHNWHPEPEPIGSNNSRFETEIHQNDEYDDDFEDLSAFNEEEQETPHSSTFEWGIQRSRSDSLIGYMRTNVLSQSLGIPSTTFSLLAEEFGFNPENIVINAGDILSRILGQIMGNGSQPMVPTDIERIPVAKINEEQASDALQCAVCFERFQIEESVRKLFCEHYFHDECIKPWLTLHSNCPICRQDLNNST